MTIDPSPRAAPDAHRRRASYLYGLVVSGAVLAAASDTYRISRIAIALLGTLVIYWASETYVHWIAAREQLRRNLTRDERRLLVLDGWPLVTACAVPLVVLLVEAALQIETSVAIDVALVVNAALLAFVGYRMSREGGLVGWQLWVSTAGAGLLGLAVVLLKAGMK